MSFIMICRNSHRNHNNKHVCHNHLCRFILQLILGTANPMFTALWRSTLAFHKKNSQATSKNIVRSKLTFFFISSNGKTCFQSTIPQPNRPWKEVFNSSKKKRKMGGYFGRSIPSPFLESDPPGSLFKDSLVAPRRSWLVDRRSVWSGRWVGHPSLLGGFNYNLILLSPQWINGTWSTYTIYWVNLPGCLLKETLSEGICPPQKKGRFLTDHWPIHHLADEFSKAQKSVDLMEWNDVLFKWFDMLAKGIQSSRGQHRAGKIDSLLRGILKTYWSFVYKASMPIWYMIILLMEDDGRNPAPPGIYKTL